MNPFSLRYLIGSDNYLWVYKLLHPATGVAVIDAAAGIVATIYDETGLTPIAGEGTGIALTFEYVPNTKSDYRCVVPGDLPVVAAKYYPVRVVVTIDALVRQLDGIMFAVTGG